MTVSPAEIPELEQRLVANSTDADLVVRYAAALFANGDCAAAAPVARQAMQLKPESAVGPLVAGQCLEREGRHGDAVSLYSSFEEAHGESPEVDVVRARHYAAATEAARAQAQAAVLQEESLAAQNDPDAMGILPLVVVGDSSLQPLSLGLAQMITSDLALLGRFRLVERLELKAIMEELELSESERIDPNTAARVGRFTRAGRMMQGVMTGRPDDEASLGATVALATGEALEAERQSGPFDDLLRLEKQMVLGIADRLGYQLSEAERQRVLENGTASLIAFLAFSRGLMAEELGDFEAAALHFADAVRADPDFQEARQRLGTSVATNVATASTPGEITTLVDQATAEVGSLLAGVGTAWSTGIIDPFVGSVDSSISDLAGMQGEIGGPGDGDRGRELNQLMKPNDPPPPIFRTVIRITLPIGQ
jgi:tetratricopeptide (TPR) repeat protein